MYKTHFFPNFEGGRYLVIVSGRAANDLLKYRFAFMAINTGPVF